LPNPESLFSLTGIPALDLAAMWEKVTEVAFEKRQWYKRTNSCKVVYRLKYRNGLKILNYQLGFFFIQSLMLELSHSV